MRDVRIGSLEWAIGTYCAVVGALMLVVPHQFDEVVYAAIREHAPAWGALFALTGCALIAVAALMPRRSIVVAVHFVAGTVVLVIASVATGANDWPITASLVILGAGTLVAPLLSGALTQTPDEDAEAGAGRPSEGNRGLDLLPVLFGLGAVASGVLLIALPMAFGAPGYELVRSHQAWFGAFFVLGGLALVYAQLRPSVSVAARRAALLFMGGVFVVFLAALPNSVSHYWVDVAYYAGFGLLLMVMAWRPERMSRVVPASLRMRLALALAAAAALPLVGVVAIVTDQYQRSATAEALTLEQALAAALAQDVGDYLDLNRSAIVGVSLQPGLAEMTPEERRVVLHTLKPAYADIIHLSSFDVNGIDVADSDDVTRPPATQRFVFVEPRRTGQAALDVFIGPTTGTPVFAFGAPVKDRNGQFAGIIGASLQSERVSQLLEAAMGGAGAQAYVIDKQSRIVAHPDASLTAALADFSEAPAVVALHADEDGRGALRYESPNGEWLAGYAQVPGLGWGVVVEQPAATALAGARAGRELAFAILLLVIGIGTGAGFLAARGLAVPLETLLQAVQKLAAGDSDAPLPRTRITEVARLATSFGELRDRLAARTAERELAEEALRESEERYRRIVETAQEGIWIIDANNVTVFANHKMAEMLGYTVAEMVGMPLSAFVDEAGQAAAAAEVRRRRQGLKKRHDAELLRRDGTKLWAIVSKNPLFDKYAQSTGTLWMVADITERKRAELERTRLLAREHATRARLEESNRMLERATQAKSEFLATMSHELRTPLNSIIGFSELLLDDGADDPETAQRRRFVSNIHQSGQHLLSLVNDILDLTKIEAGRMEVYATGFEVAASLQTVEGVIRPLAEKKGIRLETCLPAPGTAIYADEGKFRQVLYNLLSNAVKFTPAGGLVQTTAVMEDGVLRVVVADTGVGIAAEDQERIFDAFQQLDSTAARRHEGTGLGLALVRRLVELQGGHIWVESTLDEGSQFGFTVPARVEGITTAPADETTDRDLQPILESEPRRASVRTTGEVVVLQAQESGA